MDKSRDINEALTFALSVLEKLKDYTGLSDEQYEYDIQVGHPELAIISLLDDLSSQQRTLPAELFDEAMNAVGNVRGNVEQAEYSREFAVLVAE